MWDPSTLSTRSVARSVVRCSTPLVLWATLLAYMMAVYSLSSAPLEDQGPIVRGSHQTMDEMVAVVVEDRHLGSRVTPVLEHVLLFEGMGAVSLSAWGSLSLLPLRGGWHRFALGTCRLSYVLAIGVTICYGAFDEWHQGWVIGRCGSLEDVVWDTIGAIAGATAALLVRSLIMRDGWVHRWTTAV